MNLSLPPRATWQPLLESMLAEDLGLAGDLTSEAILPAQQQAAVELVARSNGTIAGLDLALHAFLLLDPQATIERLCEDGRQVSGGESLARIRGNARALLGAERTALNVLSHLSGVATATRECVDAIAGTDARVVCTRKTTPGLRSLEKYAVRAGGGSNHRFGLYDAVLIKDNHVALAGGVAPALRAARSRVGHLVKIEIEVDDLEQLDEALREGADVVLLDNMEPAELAEAVRRSQGLATTEASGGIRPDTIRRVAESGVDLISVGWITHSAPALDIGLDDLPVD